MNEYRCTRQRMGDTHESRQGYYIRATNEIEARKRMSEIFVREHGYGFDVELWKENVPVQQEPLGSCV